VQLPKDSSQFNLRTRFGRYVVRRLKCARCDDLAEECEAATRALRDAGRAEEDTEDAVQDALAARDAAGDALAAVVKDARHALAGRDLKAVREAPYTRVFPEGVEHYTLAPQGAIGVRSRQLVQRLVTHLDAADAVRVKAVDALTAGIEAYEGAADALGTARNTQSDAGVHLKAATTAWNQVLVRAYGTLIARFGKSEAERYFPRVYKPRPRKKADGEQSPTDPKAADAKKPLRSVA